MIDETSLEPLPEGQVVRTEKIDFNRLRCEACGRKIVHLLVTPPRAPVATRAVVGAKTRPHRSEGTISYQALCPYCGDKSRAQTIRGSVCPVPEPGVAIVDVEMDGDRTMIRTKTL